MSNKELNIKKEGYINLLRLTQREGIEDLITWLETKTDFFTAPASISYHGNYPGGLCEHSLNVYQIAHGIVCNFNLYEDNDLGIDENSVILASLLHDIYKVNYYTTYTRKGSDNSNNYEETHYKVDDKFPFGDGERSVIYALEFIALTMEEMLAIRWHQNKAGHYNAQNSNAMTYNQAIDKFPLITIIHSADILAGKVLGKIEKPKRRWV